MRNRLVLAAILTVVLAVSAHGQHAPQKFETGNDLFADFEACDQMNAGDASQVFNCGLIWGFVIGIVDRTITCPDASKYYDLPLGTTYGQEILVVRKYLNDHPEELHKAAITLIKNALFTAWPAK